MVIHEKILFVMEDKACVKTKSSTNDIKTKMKFHLKILPSEKIALEGKNLFFPVKWPA